MTTPNMTRESDKKTPEDCFPSKTDSISYQCTSVHFPALFFELSEILRYASGDGQAFRFRFTAVLSLSVVV